MENIFRPRYKNLINVHGKFTEYKAALCPLSINRLPETYDEVKQLLNINTSEDESRLEDSISLNHLTQLDDVRINDFSLTDMHRFKRCEKVEIPKKAMRLRCIENRMKAYKDAVSARSRPRKYNKYNHLRLDYDNTVGECDLQPYEDVILFVRVYEPFTYQRGEATSRKPRLGQEFAVMGSQRLTELRDKIYCQCKFGPFYDISERYTDIIGLETEDQQQQQTNATNDPGFFFITDTFYNDTRHTDTDYTIEIREWMNRRPEIGEVHVKSMEETRFQDLNIRLAYPQVYKHYGNCEHVFTFSDIRLLAPDDSLKRIDYPMLRIVSSSRVKICLVCGFEEACFVVRESAVHIHEPAFLCKQCLISYHYVDGKKVGTFQAFRYYGNRPVTQK